MLYHFSGREIISEGGDKRFGKVMNWFGEGPRNNEIMNAMAGQLYSAMVHQLPGSPLSPHPSNLFQTC